ncbi:hypothetical protein BCR39DRAFT_539555 [Naematelia encephala]|uniref:Uncharacterized protein n=1 Tax=Naematelia encephala TaxID=71784 RepID=A0A1Y2AWP6_9TREE|nr:hypothetical protein BCR39DRAFT_539555 [Naematelia encephala]
MSSLLRLLPNALQTPTYRPSTEPALYLNVPAFGVLYIQPEQSSDPQTSEGSSSWVGNEVKGELEVYIPPSYGPRRIRAVKVGLRGTAKMGEEGKPWSEEVFFEKELEMALVEEGLVLTDGTTRFGFNFPVPHDLAPHDHHPTGIVAHDLWGTIETQEQATHRSILKGFGRRSVSRSPGRPSRSPARTSSADRKAGREAVAYPPSYEDLQLGSAPMSSSEVMWLDKSMQTHREIRLVYNPNPSGGIADLDTRYSGYAEGLGAWEWRMVSDVWCVGALLFARLSIPAPSPQTTIVSWYIYLETTVNHFSPSDRGSSTPTPRYTHIRRHLILEAARDGPGEASWRGTQACGKETGPCRLEEKGRLPDDDDTRPSTLPHVKALLRTSHALVMELSYSVWGKDVYGQNLEHDGPGLLRLLSVRRPIMLPSCSLTPSLLNLPSYDRSMSEHFQNPSDLPCPLCKTPVELRVCSSLSCPPSMPPHPRHDHPPKLVGNERGVCRVCSRSVMPDGVVGRRNCLCMVSMAELVSRAKGFEDEHGPDQRRGDLRDQLEGARKVGEQ